MILPIQNPDGREADTRRNAYGFDMNRDWFARTQPETDGKVELLRRYPGVLFIDAHEMGSETLLLPAQRGPGLPRHRRPGGRLDQRHLRRRDAGRVRRARDPVLQLRHLRPLLRGLRRHRAGQRLRRRRHDVREGQRRPRAAAGVRAVPHPVDLALGRRDQQGADPARVARLLGRGRAPGRGRRSSSPTAPTSRACRSASRCPTARSATTSCARTTRTRRARCRGWCGACSGWTSRSGACRAPLSVPDFRAYGRAPAATTLPAGTYWIPMAQRQKHWIQAMLNESTYTPVGYAYDIVGWSSPLLFNVAGGSSGAVLSPRCDGRRRAGRAGPAGAAVQAAVDRDLLDVAAVRPRDRVLGLAALAARPLGRRRTATCRATDIATGGLERRRGAARARRLRAQGPERPVGSLRLQGPRAEGPREPEGVGAERRPLRRLARRRRARLRARDLRHGLRRRRRRRRLDPGQPVPRARQRRQPAGGRRRAVRVGARRRALRADARAPARASRCATRTRARRTSSSPARPTAPRRSAGARRRRTSASAAAAWSRSASTRTSARSPTGRRSSCATPSSAPTRRPRGPRRRAAASTRRAIRATRRLTVAKDPLRLVVRARGAREAKRVLARFGASYRVLRARRRVQFVIANPGGAQGDEHPYARAARASRCGRRRCRCCTACRGGRGCR